MPESSPPPGKVSRNPQAVSRKVGDETLVMMPEQRKLHTLNDTAGVIWDALAEPRTLDEIVEIITARFSCDRETAARDVAEYLRRLEEAGLIVRSAGRE